jgi:hypothetical protein
MIVKVGYSQKLEGHLNMGNTDSFSFIYTSFSLSLKSSF